jgi:hypothetical protein
LTARELEAAQKSQIRQEGFPSFTVVSVGGNFPIITSSVTPTSQLYSFYHCITFLQFNIMEATIAHSQEYDTDAEFIRLLDEDFARMTTRPNLMARYQIAGNDTGGQELQKERLITEKEAICEILRRITQLEEAFNAGRLKREDAAAHGI